MDRAFRQRSSFALLLLLSLYSDIIISIPVGLGDVLQTAVKGPGQVKQDAFGNTCHE
jgi:hypothetical protein